MKKDLGSSPSRFRITAHWILATVLVLASGTALGGYVLTHPRGQTFTQFGAPEAVPAGQVVLACPAVPPTWNPQAVDGNGNPLATPQIAGSTSANVLARSGEVPQDAVYYPVTSALPKGAAKGKTAGPTPTPSSPAAKPSPQTSKPEGKETSRPEEKENSGPEGEEIPEEQPDPGQELKLTPKAGALQGSYATPVPGFLVAQPWQGRVALAAADVEQSVSSGDYRGLATATCESAQQETWLVGGSTEPGNSTLLQLMNPSANPVEVKVEVWGDTGKLKFPRGEKIVLASRDSQSIPLESQVGGSGGIVVKVSATGAGVAAFLTTHSMQGLTPGGVSLVHASALPQTTQVIPGVVMTEDLGAVRILNPGEELAHASIEVVNENGRFPLPGGTEVDLDAGAVLDFTLGGLQAGNYAVVIKASAPVVAGAVVYRHGGASTSDPTKFVRDHAWLPATHTGGGVVLGPAAIDRLLLVTNLTKETKEYKVSGNTHVVNAETTAVLPLTKQTAQLVEAPELYVTQLLTTELGDGEGIDALEPAPDMAQSRQIYVHLGS